MNDNKTHRKLGNGLDCAGHSSVMLSFKCESNVRLLSPDVSFGATLPTGSICVRKSRVLKFCVHFSINSECWIKVNPSYE